MTVACVVVVAGCVVVVVAGCVVVVVVVVAAGSVVAGGAVVALAGGVVVVVVGLPTRFAVFRAVAYRWSVDGLRAACAQPESSAVPMAMTRSTTPTGASIRRHRRDTVSDGDEALDIARHRQIVLVT